MALCTSGTQYLQNAGGAGTFNDATISLWLKLTTLSASKTIAKAQFSADRVLGLTTNASSQLVVSQQKSSGASFTSSGVTITDGAWTHILARYSLYGSGDAAAQDWELWINGTLTETIAAGGIVQVRYSDSWRLGTSTSPMTCKFWQPAVWNSALTNAQIATLATPGNTPADIAATPTAWWTLADQTSGSVSVSPRDSGLDDIGSGGTLHFGTMSGAPTWDSDAPAASGPTAKGFYYYNRLLLDNQ